MGEERPSPEALLERAKAEERSSHRGVLKLYVGMAAGSGKTYAMLSDALADKRRGVDIVAGYIEPHGRTETEQLALDLAAIPTKQLSHGTSTLREFDLDAALERRPAVILIDELAHTNAPGSRHPKRWQDVDELLEQGISVHTTVNIQHLESLSDVIATITGVRVRETVPDSFTASADDIELIDITPDELIQRLKEGKVYVPEKIETALEHFFQKGNLIALREMVLRFAAERVDAQLRLFRRQQGVRELWPARPRVLVCISPNYLAPRVVRSARRLADMLRSDLIAVSVDNLSTGFMSKFAGSNTARDGLLLAESLGAQVIRRTSNDVVGEILSLAHEQNATIVAVGKTKRSRWREYLFGSVADELLRQSGDIDVYVITDRPDPTGVPLIPYNRPASLKGIVSALVVVVCATLLCHALEDILETSNLVMIYLLAVAWTSAKMGRTEAITASVAGVLAFDFFFAPPSGSFAVSDVQYVVTFFVMLTIGLLISTLTQRVKYQATVVAEREQRTATLYDLSKALAAVSTPEQIGSVVREKSQMMFHGEAALYVPDNNGTLQVIVEGEESFGREPNEFAVAQWVADRRQAAGACTDTLPGAKAIYVPLPSTSSKKAAVLAVCRSEEPFDAATKSFLEAMANQVGSALERVLKAAETTNMKVQIETQKTRNILLSSVSHDLRTPLAAISGGASALVGRLKTADGQTLELIETIREEASRLEGMVRNVLDLSRLESGSLALRVEWESITELFGSAARRTKDVLTRHELKVRLPNDLPLLRLDATFIEQLFVNLLENEAKHTPPGTCISVTGWVSGSNLVVSIEDNGPGLPKGEEGRVFEKLYRGTRTGAQGFGLGLSICEAIVNLHGGTISASNNALGGARVTVQLPLPAEQPEVPDEL